MDNGPDEITLLLPDVLGDLFRVVRHPSTTFLSNVLRLSFLLLLCSLFYRS